MINEIAQIFDRYDLMQNNLLIADLLGSKHRHEAEILYENFEDLNIYDDKSLRQYLQVIVQECMSEDQNVQICEAMVEELRKLLFKSKI